MKVIIKRFRPNMTRRRMAEFECSEGKRETSHVLRTVEAAVGRYKDEFAGPAAHLLSFLSETLKDHKVRRRALSIDAMGCFLRLPPGRARHSKHR